MRDIIYLPSILVYPYMQCVWPYYGFVLRSLVLALYVWIEILRKNDGIFMKN